MIPVALGRTSQLTLSLFFLVTQSVDLLTKTRTLYFKTSSVSCTTGRNKNINEVILESDLSESYSVRVDARRN